MALSRLIKVEELTNSLNEFYVPLCDLLMDLVEKDIDGPYAGKFTQISYSLAHDFLHLANIFGRLLWYEGVTPDMQRSPDLVDIGSDAETYLVFLRTACDIIAEAFCHFCVPENKHGQLPKHDSKKQVSFYEVICWAKENPNRLYEEFRFILKHFEWFVRLRDLRDKLVHGGHSLVAFTDRVTLRYFSYYPGRNELQMLHGGYREEDCPDPEANYPEPLLSLLKEHTLHVFDLARELSEAIQSQSQISCSRTHTLNGVYVPALHHLVSYQSPAESHLLEDADKFRLKVSAWCLLHGRNYLKAIRYGYPDSFRWKFLIRLSELFSMHPGFLFDPIFSEDGFLARWCIVFAKEERRYGFWLRDGILLKQNWLSRESALISEFTKDCDIDAVVLVARQTRIPDNGKAIAPPENFIVEDNPILAAEAAYRTLSTQC
jgi:hypothetical protein